MSDYTPNDDQVRSAVMHSGGWLDEDAFDRWLAAHDAEVRASVLAEQGEPEWEYGVTGFTGEVVGVNETIERAHESWYYWRRVIGAPSEIRKRARGSKPGPWIPLEGES